MLKVFNSLSRKKETFAPQKKNRATMYVCGPTVYGPGHIGHARTYTAFDITRKYLEYKGYRVKYVVNITDVHDDIISEAQKQGTTILELAEKNTKLFFTDIEKLGIKKADKNPRVTEHIKEIIGMIKQLQKKGFAYETEDGVYFDISKFKAYGKLSGAKAEKGKTGQRIKTDKYEKEQVQDFALWKKMIEFPPSPPLNSNFPQQAQPLTGWKSPWGKGRPGWHIECSAMATKYLGKTIDIHAGAIDLIFPHHENEIAQSECTTGKKFVKYWLHAGLLKINGQKMAKSMGNYITIPELLEKHDAIDFRFLVSQVHYKSVLDYSEQAIIEAKARRQKWLEFIERVQEAEGKENRLAEQALEKAQKGFEKAMDNDFALPNAWAALEKLQTETNRLLAEKKIGKKDSGQIIAFLKKTNSVLGVLSFGKKHESIPRELLKLIEKRNFLRKQKKWAEADEIREKLLNQGIQLIDTEQETKWKKTSEQKQQ